MRMIDSCLFVDATLIVADLHLGYEDRHEGSMGLVASSESAIESVRAAIAKAEQHGPVERLVLDGDVLDDHGLRRIESRVRITRLLRALAEERELVLVRGNHDAMLATLRTDLEVRDSFVFGDVLVAHGDRPLAEVASEDELRASRTIVIGHEHPVLALSDGIRLERFKCFVRIAALETPFGVKELLVLPSAHPDILGTDVSGSFYSPIIEDEHPEAEVFVAGDEPRAFGPIGRLATRG